MAKRNAILFSNLIEIFCCFFGIVKKNEKKQRKKKQNNFFHILALKTIESKIKKTFNTIFLPNFVHLLALG